VDDVHSATVKQGSALALSAALPGLVGASLRKGGYYAPMRSQISYRQMIPSGPPQEGIIILKLFNLTLKELGPTFLKRGVWIDGGDLSDLLKRQPDDFRSGFVAARVDGKEFDVDRLLEIKWADRHVFLRLTTPPEALLKEGNYPPPIGGKIPTLSPSFRVSSPLA